MAAISCAEASAMSQVASDAGGSALLETLHASMRSDPMGKSAAGTDSVENASASVGISISVPTLSTAQRTERP
jgi:hypothetical protein